MVPHFATINASLPLRGRSLLHRYCSYPPFRLLNLTFWNYREKLSRGSDLLHVRQSDCPIVETIAECLELGPKTAEPIVGTACFPFEIGEILVTVFFQRSFPMPSAWRLSAMLVSSDTLAPRPLNVNGALYRSTLDSVHFDPVPNLASQIQ
ncbi:hypothetical protein BgiMline_019134 [Biomphalaria glabrata]|nr:hypothetical protein BgiMline_006717 [Biomphalaria glabrata]